MPHEHEAVDPAGAGDDSDPDTYQAIMERLRADFDWLAQQGIQLSQWGPDPDSGKVRVYLARYSDEARRVLVQRYGQDVIVETESRIWRSGGGD